MIRRFNYTHRRRIDRRDLVVRRIEKGIIDVEWRLDHYGFPSDASVVVDVSGRQSFESRRLEFGSICSKLAPVVEPFDDEELDVASISLKVVAADGSARLLGLCEGLSVRAASDGRCPLLPVKRDAELGDEIWRLDNGDDGRTILLVNSKAIENVDAFVRHNELFNALVFPAIVRECLKSAAGRHSEQPEDADEEPSARWLVWARRLHPAGEPVPPDENSTLTPEREQWIDDIVGKFCARQGFSSRVTKVLNEDS